MITALPALVIAGVLCFHTDGSNLQSFTTLKDSLDWYFPTMTACDTDPQERCGGVIIDAFYLKIITIAVSPI